MMQEKKALIKVNTFSTLFIFCGVEYQPKQEAVYLSIAKNNIKKALLCQLVKKMHRPNMNNFWISCILWN